MVWPESLCHEQPEGMVAHIPPSPCSRLRHWQQVRTWARLIREAEALWHVDVRELKRLGALELSQLLEEVPPAQRPRVNRWLQRYAVATRLQDRALVSQQTDPWGERE